MDMGASWIHGTQANPMSKLADEAGATRLATSYEASIALDDTGADIDLTDANDLTEAMMEAARDKAESQSSDQSLQDAILASQRWKSADAQQKKLMRHVINGTIEAEYGGDWSEASAWNFDSAWEFGGEDAIFPDGYDQITVHLAKGLTIRTASVVESISPDGAGAAVSLKDGQVLRADHVVLTVPLGVLKANSIIFTQPLSPARQAAIDTIGMGLLNKCWLRFDRVAWPDDVDWIEWVGPNPGYWSQWFSLARTAKEPVLLAFHAGNAAREIEKLSDAETVQQAHGALKAMYGEDFPAPVDAQITRWSQDRFSGGAYSFNAVGASPATRGALSGAEWEGRVIFAGEACSANYFGTAHGAVLSGLSAAMSVL
jgi:monoamine oxidase